MRKHVKSRGRKSNTDDKEAMVQDYLLSRSDSSSLILKSPSVSISSVMGLGIIHVPVSLPCL